MNQAFEDHFSEHAQDYARYRPCYSADLFDYLAAIAPARRLAWDCGTGNGQAAVELVKHFERVVGTDASADQIAAAFTHERIEYRVERAEEASLEPGTVDLVTVAIAVHWFDFEAFYRQVRRVLKPDGVLAVWTYALPVIDAAVDRALARYFGQVLAGYWPERIRYIEEEYRTLPFPFPELAPPAFEMEADWDLGQLLGFLHSWSATRKYAKEQGINPLKIIWPELAAAWGDASRKRAICWPLHMRVGRHGGGG
ncbi:MAG TPA: class I SAM-dependent methyltransferase, partial [Anaerolineae bacterium]|nr:class I SAM-dependent methyltransferase [Anaerolineae bacterium]